MGHLAFFDGTVGDGDNWNSAEALDSLASCALQMGFYVQMHVENRFIFLYPNSSHFSFVLCFKDVVRYVASSAVMSNTALPLNKDSSYTLADIQHPTYPSIAFEICCWLRLVCALQQRLISPRWSRGFLKLLRPNVVGVLIRMSCVWELSVARRHLCWQRQTEGRRREGSGAKKVTVHCYKGRHWGEIILKLHFGVTSENRGARVFFFLLNFFFFWVTQIWGCFQYFHCCVITADRSTLESPEDKSK